MRWLFALSLAVIALLGVVAARQALYRTADLSRYDGSPLPRPIRDAPFITTPDVVVEAMVDLAEIAQDDLVYDLGCGDGRLVIAAAKRTGCRGVGIDKDPQRVAEARENAQRQGVDQQVRIEERDVFTVDLREADVVLMYLLPRMLEALVPQLEVMPPGARIVSHDFSIAGLEPQQTTEFTMPDTRQVRRLFLYTTPLTRSPPKPKKKS